MEHMEHDHSAHAGGHPAASVSELHHPHHGSYEGHVVPAVMFIIWATYWLWSVLDIHLRSPADGQPSCAAPPLLPQHTTSSSSSSAGPARPRSSSSSSGTKARGRSPAGLLSAHSGHAGRGGCCSARRRFSTGRYEAYRSRAWYAWPYWPAPHLEPIFKVLLPLIGVMIELYVGWGGWRPMYKADGHFAAEHIGNWQHALMYGGVAVSGVVDLIGYLTPLPQGTEQVFLAAAFLVETLLMGMHVKPNPLDQLVHVMLTWVMWACVAVCTAELAAPHSLLLGLARPVVVLFQGTWFWHVGSIMFHDHMAWDMDDMGGVMFVPVVFCLHILLILLGVFTVYLFMRFVYARAGITSPSHFSSHGGAAGSTHHPYQQLPLASKLHHHASDAADGAMTCDDDDDGDSHSLETALELVDYPTLRPGSPQLHQLHHQHHQHHNGSSSPGVGMGGSSSGADAAAGRERDVSRSNKGSHRA